MKIEKKKGLRYFFTSIAPAFLLGLNYIFYNALDLDATKQIIRIVAMTLVFVGWVLRKDFRINRIQMIFIIAIIIEAFINGLSILNIAAAVIFAICTGDDIKSDEKYFFRISIVLVGFVLLLISLDILENYTYISTMGRLRSTLGFGNPNVAALFYSSAIYLYMLSREKIRIRNIFVAALLEGVIYYYTNSRTSFFALAVFMVLLFAMRSPYVDFVAKGCRVAVDAFFCLNLISVFTINSFMKYNTLLSGRISSYAKMINDAGTTGFLFGGSSLSVDSFYYMFLFNYGAIAYLFFWLMVHHALNELSKKKYFNEVAFLTSFFSLGIMESSVMRPEIISVLLIWKLMVQKVCIYKKDVFSE